VATLELFERERTLERMAPKIALLRDSLAELVAELPGVAEVRQRGFMVGIELVAGPVAERRGHLVTLAARERGAIIRPLGDVIVLMPAPAMSAADLRRLVEITAASIAAVTARELAPAT
jgi:adenosylmethionine-8-amino-7-oxononanoate aminotransferase